MSPQEDMEFTERDSALDYATMDTNEELVKTIVKYKLTRDEFNGVVEPERTLLIKQLFNHYCAIHGIDTDFYLSTPKETCSVEFRDDMRTSRIKNLPNYENPHHIVEDICEYRITRQETKGLFSKLRQTVVENKIQKLAKEGFDISFFDREETDFYGEESGDEDCPSTISSGSKALHPMLLALPI